MGLKSCPLTFVSVIQKKVVYLLSIRNSSIIFCTLTVVILQEFINNISKSVPTGTISISFLILALTCSSFILFGLFLFPLVTLLSGIFVLGLFLFPLVTLLSGIFVLSSYSFLLGLTISLLLGVYSSGAFFET